MIDQNIEYVPISRLSRGYAGQIIDNMHKNDSVIYIIRNNEPTAVILSIDDYNIYLQTVKAAQRINKTDAIRKTAGSLHRYADTEKIDGEKEFYRQALSKRNG